MACDSESGNAESALPTPSIVVKYDMGWQKRGSGCKYDFLSGVGTVIGNETGKVIGCKVKLKSCAVCSI